MENHNAQPWLPTALRYGLILGLLAGLAGVGLQLLQDDPVNPKTSAAIISLLVVLVMFGVSLGFNYKAVADYRDDLNGGWITLGKAFLIGLAMYFIADMVAAVINFLYLSFLLPAEAKEALQEAIEATEERMADAPPILKNFTTRAMSSALNPASAFIGPFVWLIWNAIKAIIMAAITKKDQPLGV